jgi:hypothetical protein
LPVFPQAVAFDIDETAYELPPERRRPRGFMHVTVFRERERFYWEPDLGKEDREDPAILRMRPSIHQGTGSVFIGRIAWIDGAFWREGWGQCSWER